ncbi:hypothetical protein M406DRAFT_333163 [Cryphonectria parasitica EP155]|uniref:Uncharacterized protein n=1 Tax=Cryphonectria parasitica (strain ATCC 38755 / EP155) TaxID=660469 RepID=A0A9P4XXQ6_CRYP1|nr:uncharacterized protein M406DRAFT_333163 [Cryphonectria parasitica EP155]KAF3762791.1 hypothetical protein M406DRAFT_333163 [Cryphonectria parasitica EP155]
MPLPPITTIAACGSIMTAVKSGWELSRMIKKKDAEKRLDQYARALLKDLRSVHLDGLMNRRTFDQWYDRFLGALAEKDMMELRKIREHVNLVYRDKARVTRRNTYTNKSSSYTDEKRTTHRRAHSADRRQSSRGPPPAYTVEEWEEKQEAERRRPKKVDTAKAQRDYYYAHALPSPYKGELEYTPKSDEFDGSEKDRGRYGSRHSSRHSSHHREGTGSRPDSFRSRSTSTVERGRTRSRSVHTEQRVLEEEDEDSLADIDSEAETYYGRRRASYYSHGDNGVGRDERAGRGGR